MIELLGESWTPALPPSYTVRAEVVFAYLEERKVKSTPIRCAAAAIGITWAHPTVRLKATYESCGEDPLAYGRAVFDELQALAAPIGAIFSNGALAIDALDKSMITEEHVQTQADFSAASPARTGSGSGPAASVGASASARAPGATP